MPAGERVFQTGDLVMMSSPQLAMNLSAYGYPATQTPVLWPLQAYVSTPTGDPTYALQALMVVEAGMDPTGQYEQVFLYSINFSQYLQLIYFADPEAYPVAPAGNVPGVYVLDPAADVYNLFQMRPGFSSEGFGIWYVFNAVTGRYLQMIERETNYWPLEAGPDSGTVWNQFTFGWLDPR